MQRATTLFIAGTIAAAALAQHHLYFEASPTTSPAQLNWSVSDAQGILRSSGEGERGARASIALPDGSYQLRLQGNGGSGTYMLRDVSTGLVIAGGTLSKGDQSIGFQLPHDMDGGGLVPTPLAVTLEQVASGFSQITDLANCGDERMFVVQRGGSVRIIDGNGNTLPTPFLTIPSNQIISGGQEQGLLSLVFHPDYANNGEFFVNYTAPGLGGDGHSRVSRFRVSGDPNVADVASEQILYVLPQPYGNHNGGDMEFGPDGYLYVGFGDGGSANDPQNHGQTHSSALGTMLRLDVDGGDPYAIPADNPFVNTQDTLPEIWATGLRNPWRFAFDELTGDLYIGDVGQNAWEEVNFMAAGEGAGANYGWRCYEGNANFNLNGCLPASAYVFPVAVHANSFNNWCSITGGRVYRGSDYPRLYGRYFYTDFCKPELRSLARDGEGAWQTTVVLASSVAQVSTFGTNSAMELFLARLPGTIHRIKDACTAPAPVITVNGIELTSTPGSAYAWTLNGTLIPGADAQTYTATENGVYQVLVEVNTGCVQASAPVEVTGVGMEELAAATLLLWPNPAGDQLRISGIPAGANDMRLELHDQAGRIVAAYNPARLRDGMTLDISRLQQGAYIVLLRDGSGVMHMATRLTVVR